MYIVCMFITYASQSLNLTYLLLYLPFPLRIIPLRFRAGCRKKRLNLAIVFVFILCCSIFLVIGEYVLLLCWV